MNRRLFLKTMGVSSVGLASTGYLMANNFYLPDSKVVQFPPDELKRSLTQFINRYFTGQLFNPNEPLPNQIVLVADAFEVVANNEKNNIFDISEIVIEKCKSIGFDASILKDGYIPVGMKVSHGGFSIRTPEEMLFFKLEELKDYDAIVYFHKGFLIKSSLPPAQWNTVGKIQLAYSSKHGDIYKDKNNKLTIKISSHNKKEYIRIKTLKPKLEISPNQNFRVPISSEIGTKFLSRETKDLIFNN